MTDAVTLKHAQVHRRRGEIKEDKTPGWLVVHKEPLVKDQDITSRNLAPTRGAEVGLRLIV